MDFGGKDKALASFFWQRQPTKYLPCHAAHQV